MQYLLAMVYGAVFGIANIIPGVSGGTMLVTFGCYDKVCGALALNLKEIKKNIKFLIFFAIGAVVGLVGFSNVISWLFVRFPTETYMFFMGLILGSVPLIIRNATKKEKFRPTCLIPFLLSLAIVVGLTIAEGSTSDPVAVSAATSGGAATVTITNNSGSDLTNWSIEVEGGQVTAVEGDVALVFEGGKTEMLLGLLGIEYDTTPNTIKPLSDGVLAAGDSVSFTARCEGEPIFTPQYMFNMSAALFVTILLASLAAAMAMIIPGVSGSFIMVLLGTYSTVVGAVKDFNFVILLPAAVGIVIGLVFGARLIRMLMARWRLMVFSAILGLCVGSLFAILPSGFGLNLDTLIGFAALLIGGGISLLVGKNTKAEE